ncbi:Dual specificity protein phosphatase Mpk3 [Diplonema papillatum]|nr:Dual specificity protein phosphatase Mpk3 [Diplonema papillatum]
MLEFDSPLRTACLFDPCCLRADSGGVGCMYTSPGGSIRRERESDPFKVSPPGLDSADAVAGYVLYDGANHGRLHQRDHRRLSGGGRPGDELPLPLHSPSHAQNWRRTKKRRSLLPQHHESHAVYRTGAAAEGEAVFTTPSRSEDEERLEKLLASAVRYTDDRLHACSTLEHHPFEITPWIFCGTAKYASQVSAVAADGFTHVINMCPTQAATSPTAYKQHGIELTIIPAQDTSDYPLLSKHFAQCYTVAETARQSSGRVLLHCLKAVNRSVAMGIALRLRQVEGSSLTDAVRFVADKRTPVLQNNDFRRQLVHFSSNMQMYTTAPPTIPFTLSPKSSSPGSCVSDPQGTPRISRRLRDLIEEP